jgi:hypothetical protein
MDFAAALIPFASAIQVSSDSVIHCSNNVQTFTPICVIHPIESSKATAKSLTLISSRGRGQFAFAA